MKLDNVDPPAVGNTDIVHVSHGNKWTWKSGYGPRIIWERIHGIQPTSNCSRRNPGMYGPLKVGIKRLLKVSYLGVKG